MSVVPSPAGIEATECAPVPHVRARMCGRVGCVALCSRTSELEAERLEVYHFFCAPAPRDVDAPSFIPNECLKLLLASVQ